MALPILAASAAASGLTSLLDAFKPHKKHHSGSQSGATSGADSTGQNVPTGNSGQAGFDPAALLAKMDSDKSGGVSKGEFGSFLQSLDQQNGGLLAVQAQASGTSTDQVASTLFSKLDSNGDGSLSSDELSALGKGHGNHRHARAGDADAASQAQAGSGKSLTDQLMASFDGNGDGSISKDEITAALDATRNGDSRGSSLVRSHQPNLEALAARAIQAYSRTLSASSSTAA
ncbi:hypothetical protein SLNSH_13955 [Alsobacter soli]|uniref:EF-hand domain-containing protein n=1 Tax=Alsobacter soli TaxID=2109933 RepID=A0A2T1HRP2_9HYPH|nr:EF-hand domain-containing protein [Alsobacter soli]PSC04331.1 hypothetical protein SLNSH_13955 [Alsobacter soli]